MPPCVPVSCAFHSINYILFLTNLAFHFTRIQVSFSFVTTLIGSLNNSKLHHTIDRTMTDLRMSLTFFVLSEIFFGNEQPSCSYEIPNLACYTWVSEGHLTNIGFINIESMTTLLSFGSYRNFLYQLKKTRNFETLRLRNSYRFSNINVSYGLI